MKWRVYPTEPIKGFRAVTKNSEMSAEWEQLRLEIATGKEWNIKRI